MAGLNNVNFSWAPAEFKIRTKKKKKNIFLVPYQRQAATRPPQATIFFLTQKTEICRLVKFQLQWMQPTKVTVDSSCSKIMETLF